MPIAFSMLYLIFALVGCKVTNSKHSEDKVNKSQKSDTYINDSKLVSREKNDLKLKVMENIKLAKNLKPGVTLLLKGEQNQYLKFLNEEKKSLKLADIETEDILIYGAIAAAGIFTIGMLAKGSSKNTSLKVDNPSSGTPLRTPTNNGLKADPAVTSVNSKKLSELEAYAVHPTIRSNLNNAMSSIDKPIIYDRIVIGSPGSSQSAMFYNPTDGLFSSVLQQQSKQRTLVVMFKPPGHKIEVDDDFLSSIKTYQREELDSAKNANIDTLLVDSSEQAMATLKKILTSGPNNQGTQRSSLYGIDGSGRLFSPYS